MKKIAIIILHFKNLENTKECVESAFDLRNPDELKKTVIVVDNASDEPYESKASDLIIVRNTKNLGFTGGMNTGIRKALRDGFDYILTINNDTVFDKGFLTKIYPSLDEENVGIFSPKIYFYPGTEYHHDRYKESQRGKVIWFAGGKIDSKNFLVSHRGVDEVDRGQFDLEKTMDFSTGCCMVFPKKAIEEVGIFDEKYFLYYEDVDLSLRMKEKGKKLVFVPQAVIWHKNAKSAGGAGSELQDYYSTRNRIYLGMKYSGTRVKVALLREGARLLLSGRKWQRVGARDFFLRIMGKGSFLV